MKKFKTLNAALLLALALLAMAPPWLRGLPDALRVALVLGISGWIPVARYLRAEFMRLRDSDVPAFRERLWCENHTLKRALTDPRLFSGIGNAYSDEILHAARLSPLQWTRNLSGEAAQRLFDSVRSILAAWRDRLIAETGAYSVSSVRPEDGPPETVPLLTNLPGFPDNMATGTDGLVWVALASPRNPADGEAISPEQMSRTLIELRKRFSTVIVDTPAGLDQLSRMVGWRNDRYGSPRFRSDPVGFGHGSHRAG